MAEKGQFFLDAEPEKPAFTAHHAIGPGWIRDLVCSYLLKKLYGYCRKTRVQIYILVSHNNPYGKQAEGL